MHLPINLQTKQGFDFYRSVHTVYQSYKENNAIAAFKSSMAIQLQEISDELTLFLDSDTMYKQHQMNDEDTIGWLYYKETADKYSVLNYFYNRTV
jgi:hypothetical protein